MTYRRTPGLKRMADAAHSGPAAVGDVTYDGATESWPHDHDHGDYYGA